MILLYIIFVVYILAINFYSFLLVKSQKDDYEETGKLTKGNDGKLFLSAFLGGALSIYICMFIFKYRTKSLFLMITMPILSVLNIYLFYIAFRSGFTFIVF